MVTPSPPVNESILVTGATGFLGRHVLFRLAAEGKVSAHALVRPGRPLPPWLEGHEVVRGDITRPKTLPELARGSTVVHLAGVADLGRCERYPRLAARAHVEGTLNVLRMAAAADARVVLASTAQVYGPLAGRINEGRALTPTSVYGATKAAAEHLLSAFADRVPSVAIRLFNLYGPGQGPYAVVPAIVRQLRHPATRALQLNALGPRRDFLWVEDAADLIIRGALGDATGVVNAASGQSRTIGEVAQAALEVSGRRLPIEAAPGRPESEFQVSVERALRQFGWRPTTSLAAGLGKLLGGSGVGTSAYK